MAICDLCATQLGPGALEISPAEMRVIAGNGYGVHVPVWKQLTSEERRAKLYQVAITNDTPWALCPSCHRRTREYAVDRGGGPSHEEFREVALKPLLEAMGRARTALPPDEVLSTVVPPSGFVLTGHKERVMSVAISRDGRRALSAGWDEVVILWDLEARAEIRRFKGHRSFISAVAFLGDGQHAVSAGADRVLRVWDCEAGSEVFRLSKHSFTIHQLAVSADGRFVLTASGDGTARLFDVRSGSHVRKLGGFFGGTHGSYVSCAALTPDGAHALTGGGDSEVKYWDVAANRVIHSFRGFSHNTNRLAFLPDGHRALVVAGTAPSLIDLTTGRVAGEYASAAKSFRALSISQDGRFLAVGDVWNGVFVRVLDLATGGQIRQFEGHTKDVTSVALSANGRRVVSGSDDWTVRVCDVG